MEQIMVAKWSPTALSILCSRRLRRTGSRGPFGIFGGIRRSMSSFAKASEDTRMHSSTALQQWLPA